MPVSFSASWDGASNSLQNILNTLYGPNQIVVATDFIGAHPTDPDPWFWVDTHFHTLLLKEVAGNADRNTIGWYLETGVKPVLTFDNLHDGQVFSGPASAGATATVNLVGPNYKFGFYMNPNGTLGATNAPEPEKFYTNRMYNDIGRSGGVPLHAPVDGDVQALVFNISNVVMKRNTWLVCFEDLDSGGAVGTETDNDYNDLIFEVCAVGTTPVSVMSAGQLRIRYK